MKKLFLFLVLLNSCVRTNTPPPFFSQENLNSFVGKNLGDFVEAYSEVRSGSAAGISPKMDLNDSTYVINFYNPNSGSNYGVNAVMIYVVNGIIVKIRI